METDDHLDTNTNERITREYTAYSGGNHTTLTQSYPKNIYEYYANQYRQYIDNDNEFKYGSYVSDRFDRPMIESIVSSFEEYGKQNDHTDREVIEHMMSFVQNLEYTTDKRGTGFNEYPKYPIETLVEREGDCEDTSILMANLLRNYGYGTKLISATADMTDGDAGGHMAVGVKGEDSVYGTYYEDNQGDRYYFIETTAPDTPIGEAPSWMNKARLRPVGVHPVPGAVRGTITEVSNNSITVKGDALNTGAAGTERLQIQLSLIDSDRRIVDQHTSGYKSVAGFSGKVGDLGAKHQATVQTALMVQEPEELRLVAQSLVNGDLISQTESPLRAPE